MLVLVHGLERLERDALRGTSKPPGDGAAQRAEMGAAAQRVADVFAEHADVGALAARGQPSLRKARRRKLNFELVNGDRARFALERDAFARVFVVSLAVALERGVHRRHLQDRAAELRQHRFFISLAREVHIPGLAMASPSVSPVLVLMPR